MIGRQPEPGKPRGINEPGFLAFMGERKPDQGGAVGRYQRCALAQGKSGGQPALSIRGGPDFMDGVGIEPGKNAVVLVPGPSVGHRACLRVGAALLDFLDFIAQAVNHRLPGCGSHVRVFSVLKEQNKNIKNGAWSQEESFAPFTARLLQGRGGSFGRVCGYRHTGAGKSSAQGRAGLERVYWPP